jgi:uncharacterized membrane protein required for colicin V production
MSDVLNGISHFLGICVGIVILLFVLGFALQNNKPPPSSKPPKKKSHYHLVYSNNNYNNKNNSNNNNNSQNIESYQSSDPFSNSVSNY